MHQQFNPLKPTGYVMYQQFLLKPTGYVMHQQFNLLKPTGYVMHQQFNLLKPTGYVMHQQFNLLKPPGYVMHQQFKYFSISPLFLFHFFYSLYPQCLLLNPSLSQLSLFVSVFFPPSHFFSDSLHLMPSLPTV